MLRPVVARVLCAVLLVTTMAACRRGGDESLSAGATTTLRAPGDGRIAFLGLEGDDVDSSGLFVMDGDGTAVRRLTDANVAFFSPALSPDGRRILFEGICVGGARSFDPDMLDRLDICSIDADGTNLREVRTGAGAEDPAWAPDGERIAYSRSSWSGDADIWVAAADGTGARRVTGGPGKKRSPSWAPDGRSIAFESDEGGTRQIHVVSSDGGPSTRLAPGGSFSEGPSWSNDGRRIAFYSDRSDKPESAHTKELRRAPGGDLLPPSLPAPDIFVMDADGSDVVRVTSDAFDNLSPDWSPDDRSLVFVSDRDGRHQLYVMAVDGTGQRRLTTGFGSAEFPSWSR